jgi:hypothetical protein
MMTQVIIWALVLALFGTNGGSAKIRRIATVMKTMCRFASAHQQSTTETPRSITAKPCVRENGDNRIATHILSQ